MNSIAGGDKQTVLLFYDGFERKALAGVMGQIYSQSRRAARYYYRRLRSRQTHTGFYTAFLGLVRCLRQAGCDVRINDFGYAARHPHMPIGIAGYPSVIDAVSHLPNPRIFGPGDFGPPLPGQTYASDQRFKRLIQPCDWAAELYFPFCRDKMMVWYAGIDTTAWADLSRLPKTVDFLIYDKIRWERETLAPHILGLIRSALDQRGLSHETLRYGGHELAQFKAGLQRARAMIFICEHETQGLAYQEAMASGVPILAWDEGVFADPILQSYTPPQSPISSVPYFDARCGERFKLKDFEAVLDRFIAQRDGYAPRAYVRESLSYAGSAKLYLDAYTSVAAQG